MWVYIGSTELKNAYIGEYNWMGVLPSTVCSYPFIENNTDLTWKTTLSSGGTKQTIGYKFSWTSDISYGSGGTATSIFASYRIKSNRAYGTNGNCLIGGTEKWRMGYNLAHVGGYQNAVQFSNWTWYKSSTLWTVDTWMHIAYWFNWTEAYVYKDWVKQVIATSTTYEEAVNKYFIDRNWSQYDVTVAYFLIDWIDREGEIVPFFNETKSQFWL